MNEKTLFSYRVLDDAAAFGVKNHQCPVVEKQTNVSSIINLFIAPGILDLLIENLFVVEFISWTDSTYDDLQILLPSASLLK